MKTSSLLLTISIALAIGATALISSHAQDPDWKPPGSDEAAAVERANAEIDKVYGQLKGALDPEQQKSLRDAQRAWIKWRDAEAEFVARLGGAIGGSALRVDYSVAQAKLIQERTEVLKEYLKQAKNKD